MESPKGLAVKQALEVYYGEPVNHGRLYPNLDDLVDEGYIDKGVIDKRTNSYDLSAEGREALEERRKWEDRFMEGQVTEEDLKGSDGVSASAD